MTSPTGSTSPSPKARTPFPSLAFEGANSIPFKSPPSPPSTSLSPSPFSPASSSSRSTRGYSDWPKRDCLSTPSFSASSNDCQATSYISDEDLLDLEELPLYNDIRIPETMFANRAQLVDWEVKEQPPVVLLQSVPAERKEKAAPAITQRRRRRSSPLKKRKLVMGMSPIAEER